MKNQPERHPQLPISEEMKAWSTALLEETKSWPRITQRSFFGFTALYRGDAIFGLLPRSRNLESANTIAFKIESPTRTIAKRLAADPRIGSIQKENARWHTVLLASNADLHNALDWLGVAYEATRKQKKSR